MESFEFIREVACKLSKEYNERDLELTLSLSNSLERAQRIIDMSQDVLRNSLFRFYKEDYYYFTGRIYECIGFTILSGVLKELLIVLKVCPSDRYMMERKFVSKCLETIRMKPLNPKYSVLCFKNCVLDVEKNEVYDFSPEFDCIHLLNYDYSKEARCPQWTVFLQQVLPESGSRMILQEYFGLGFVNRQDSSNKIENVLMLYGTGSNGKSVILNTIQGVLGHDTISNCSLLSMIKGCGDERYRTIAMIDGKRFNMCTEIQAKDISSYSDAFKQLVSGEPQIGRFLKHDPYVVFNIPYLVFNANRLPTSNDMSYGFMRRFIIIPFERIFTKEEQNTALEYELRSEYAGIMNWMLAGMRRLKRNGYKFSSSEAVDNAVDKYLCGNSNAFQFMADCGYRYNKIVEDEVGGLIQMSELYGKYLDWCDRSGDEPLSLRRFSDDLCISADEYKKRGGDVRKYVKRRRSDGIFVEVYGVQYDKIRKSRVLKGKQIKSVIRRNSLWEDEADAAGRPYSGNEDALD